MEDPLYAQELLADILNDGSNYEIQRVQSWYDEAKARSKNSIPKYGLLERSY